MEFLTYDEEDESDFSLSYIKIIYLDLSSIRYNHKIPIVFETKECNFRKYNTTEEQKLDWTCMGLPYKSTLVAEGERLLSEMSTKRFFKFRI
jgi:hypothetical protein